jgi:hypothetical protein
MEVVAVQGDTAIPVRGAREERLGETAGELVLRIDAALRSTQHLHRNRGEPLILEEALMGGGVVGLEEGLMPLLQFDGVRAREN